MRRRAKNVFETSSSGSHAQRWIISYADFMTLLFAFFVVLYASSVVHEEKFKALKQTFSNSFTSSVQLPDSVQVLLSDTFNQIKLPKPFFKSQYDQANQREFEADLDLEHFDYDVMHILQQGAELEPMLSVMNMVSHEQYIQLEIPSQAIFFPQSERLNAQGEQLMNILAKQFAQFPHSIKIEVFTASFSEPENQNPWALGAQQGAVLLQWLQLEGINSIRLSAINYGPYRPIATNDDEEGLNINRRIHFLIELDDETEYRLSRIHQGHLLTPNSPE